MRAFLVWPKKTIRRYNFILTPDMEVHVQSRINGFNPSFNEIVDRYLAKYNIDIRNGAVNLSDFNYKKIG